MPSKPKPDKPLQAKATKPKTKNKGGRPSTMTEAVQFEICARLGSGENLSQICRDPKMPSRTAVTNYLAKDGPENLRFRTNYASARESLHDVWAEEIITISDDGTTDYITKVGRNGHEYQAVDQEHIQRSRLRVDSRKWLLSKLRPGQYGDKVTAEVSGSVAHVHDISSLSEREKMRRFALFMVEDQRQPTAIEGEAISKPLKESTQANDATMQAQQPKPE